MTTSNSKASNASSTLAVPTSPVTANVALSLDVEVPREDWIDYLTQCNDIFSHLYCGYWLRGVEHTKSRGWLCWEDDEERTKGSEPDRKKALRVWRAGGALPAGWFRLDETAAIKAYLEGVKLWGPNWFDEKGDANTYYAVVQMALLGELRYG